MVPAISMVFSRFKSNAEKMSNKFRDRQNTPLETAIFWTEYVIRHNGAPELRSVGADLPWYQYYLVDVILVFVGSVAFALYLVYFFVGRIVLSFTRLKQVKEKKS